MHKRNAPHEAPLDRFTPAGFAPVQAALRRAESSHNPVELQISLAQLIDAALTIAGPDALQVLRDAARSHGLVVSMGTGAGANYPAAD